ncbi:MAG: 2-polyprenyl-3-methyl-5-hydroxy-6-metoxy-1,4-benzoquinol methylase [Cyclobacteriaceae bacterium]|jgi:2-polyprenyl-3-methyl-5-hydroxy-6-metoxy-1,4-benzoquinol methylase
MSVFTTEITSDAIPSDNVIHQRLSKAYEVAVPYIQGDVLELGCGEGRGIDLISPKASSYLGLDKIEVIINRLKNKYPKLNFESGSFPPVQIKDNSFDTIVTFQVIEHIKHDRLFLEEIYRLLKPGGTALISTPNIKMTLSRNPWHEREYTNEELTTLASSIFDNVEMKGIAGNDRIMEYHERNRESVNKIMRFDILNLEHKLPASILRVPYDLVNRMNRNKLLKKSDNLVRSITTADFSLQDRDESNLDLYLIVKRN